MSDCTNCTDCSEEAEALAKQVKYLENQLVELREELDYAEADSRGLRKKLDRVTARFQDEL